MKDEYSETYGRNSRIPARRHSYNSRLEILRHSVSKNGLVLDVGSATGDYAIDLWNDGYDVICCDIDLENLRTLKTKEGNLDAVEGNAVELPFKDESFETVMSLNSFRYFINGRKSLTEFNRVLKTGGLLVLIDHNRLCPDTLMFTYDVARYYTLKELKEMLSETGFRTVSERLTFVPPPWIPGTVLEAVSDCMGKVGRIGINLIYPEITIKAVKGEQD